MSVGSSDWPTITWQDSNSQEIAATGDGSRAVSATTMNSNGNYSRSLSFNPLAPLDAGLFMCKVMVGGVTEIETINITVNSMFVDYLYCYVHIIICSLFPLFYRYHSPDK